MRGPCLSLVLLLLFAGAAHADDLVVACERTAATTERPALTVRSTQAGPVGVELYQVQVPERFFAGAGDLTRPERLEAALEAYVRALEAEPAGVASFHLGAARTLPYPTASKPERLALDPLPPGLYVVQTVQTGLTARALLLVSDLALVTKRDASGLLAWAVHRVSGAPRPGVEVRATDAAGTERNAVTGPDGVVRIAGSFAPDVTVRARDGDHWAFGSERWYPADVPARRVFVVAHQPAYRPGERVEVRGVVRAVDADGHPALDPTVTSARLVFVGPGDRVFGTPQDVAVSADLGTFAGGLTLPKEGPTGACEARVEIGGKEYAAPFVVDAYRKPPFEVRVGASQPRVLAGEKVRFTVTAKGFDGSRLPDAPVTWSLVHHRVERELFDSDEFARLFFGTERDAFAPKALANGTGKLNAESALEIRAEVAKDLLDGYVTLQATVVGPGGLHVAGSGVCGVSTARILVQVKTDKYVYAEGEKAEITIRAQNADGTPTVGFVGTLHAIHNITNGKLPVYPFVTDARGEARVTKTMGPWTSHYVVTATGSNEALADSAVVYTIRDGQSLGYSGQLAVVTDKDDYAPGDTATILVLSPWPKRALLATVEGARLFNARVLTPEVNGVHYKLTLDESHGPNLWVAVAALDQGHLVTASRMLRIPPRTRRLATTVTPDAAEVGPGATSGATLEVRDHAGEPVAGAEVSLAVVDEALHALFPDAGVSIEAFFNPLRRNSVATGGPLHLATLGHAHRDVPPAKAGAEGSDATAPPPANPAPSPAEAPRPEPAPQGVGSAGGGAGGPGRLVDLDGVTNGLEDKTVAGFEDGGVEFRGLGGNPRPSVSKTRADFRTCVHWAPALRTGADGRVRVEGIRYADSLTRWRLTALAVDAQTRVGTGTGEVRTKRDVAIDVTLPRFLVVGDRVEAPVLVTNLTEADLTGGGWMHWSMQPPTDEGGRQPQLRLLPGVATRNSVLEIRAAEAGTVHVLGRADAGRFTDSIRRSLPVLPQGFEASTGRYVEAQTVEGRLSRAQVSLEIPPDLERSTLKAWLSVEPTALAAVARALPYLVGYPHGCTEQTLSRFEPLVVAAEVADALEIPRRGVLAEVPEMVRAGVERLALLQHADGGFGWWPSDASNLEMTVRAARTLGRTAVREAGGSRAEAVLERALGWLVSAVAATSDPRARLEALAVLREAGRVAPDMRVSAAAAMAALEQDRRGKALVDAFVLLSVTGDDASDVGFRRILARDLAAQAVREGAYARFGGGDGSGPADRWDDPIETTAVALRALWHAGERGSLVDAGVRWLLAQRVNGEVWRSTRDTAAAVELLALYGREQALTGDVSQFTIKTGESVLAQVDSTRDTFFATDVSIDVTRAIEGGDRVAVTVEGQGGFGVNLTLSGFATGPAIARRENGFRVERRFFRLDPVTQDGRVVHVRSEVTETMPAGTLLECELVVTTDRARDYVQVTSPYAAGFEPEREVALEVPGRAPAAKAETERFDERVEFFVTHMAAGTHVFRHLARATHAGTFTALPARARLMYFPTVSGSSKGEVLEVRPTDGGAR